MFRICANWFSGRAERAREDEERRNGPDARRCRSMRQPAAGERDEGDVEVREHRRQRRRGQRDEVGVLAGVAGLVAELLELCRIARSSTRYALIVRSPVISSSAAPFKAPVRSWSTTNAGPEWRDVMLHHAAGSPARSGRPRSTAASCTMNMSTVVLISVNTELIAGYRPLSKQLVHRVEVVRDPAHQVADGLPVEEAQRQGLRVLEDLLAQPVHGVLRGDREQAATEPHGRRSRRRRWRAVRPGRRRAGTCRRR